MIGSIVRRRALAIAEGSPIVFLTRPLSATLLAAAAILLFAPMLDRFRRRRHEAA